MNHFILCVEVIGISQRSGFQQPTSWKYSCVPKDNSFLFPQIKTGILKKNSTLPKTFQLSLSLLKLFPACIR